MTLRRFLVATHRRLGLIAAALWIVQAATGVFAVFHWEIDDAIAPGAHHSTDWNAIERKVTALRPSSIWTTAGAPDRYDVNVGDRTIRIDGEGNVLRVRTGRGIIDTIVELHQSLVAGDIGRWITGGSGVLLISNAIFGVVAAWPRHAQWKRVLTPMRSPSRMAVLYSWHRAAGLWLVVPAACLLLAGALLAWDPVTERLLRVHDPKIAPVQGKPAIGLSAATATALSKYPGAEISGIGFPKPDDAAWTIWLKQRGERQGAYGKTRVVMSAVDGRVIAAEDALKTAPSRRIYDHLFALHTGQIFGVAGRIAALSIGLWLVAMIVLGVAMWWTRR